MNTDKIIPVNREHLLLMQVLCWLGPGVKIFITGLKALQQVQQTAPQRVWWLVLIALAVVVSFSLMFNNFVSDILIGFSLFQSAKNRYLLFSTCEDIYLFSL